MRISISSQVDLSSLDPVLIQLSTLNYSETIELLELEFASSAQTSFHPAALTALAAHAFRVDSRGGIARLLNEEGMPAHLKRMGLNNFFGLRDSSRPYLADPTGRYIPIQRVTTTRQVGDLVTDFVPLLHAELTTAKAVSYVLWELLRNVLEHAGSPHGAFVSADLTPDGRVRLGVADAGIGVPRSIRRSHSAYTDRDALELAFQPGVSGTTSRFGGNETNGGAGLFFLRSMCAVAGQPLVLASGSSMSRMESRAGAPVSLSDALETATTSWVELPTSLTGTVVGVDLRLEDAGEYEQLFAQIRGVYHSRVQDRRKVSRRARFS